MKFVQVKIHTQKKKKSRKIQYSQLYLTHFTILNPFNKIPQIFSQNQLSHHRDTKPLKHHQCNPAQHNPVTLSAADHIQHLLQSFQYLNPKLIEPIVMSLLRENFRAYQQALKSTCIQLHILTLYHNIYPFILM